MAEQDTHTESQDDMPGLATEHELKTHSSDSREIPMDAETEGIKEIEPEYPDQSDLEIARRASQATVKDSVKELHPYAQTLGINDLESCLALENATFSKENRASREKLEYRLNKCGQLCLGLFTSAEPGTPAHDAETSQFANPPDSSAPDRKGVLLGQIIATLTTNELVKDEDMDAPENWQENRQAETGVGHKENGRTLAIHSFAVLPAYQRRGLGTTLLKAYVQRMVEGEVADRISILTYEHLVPYYRVMGFKNLGKSDSKHGGTSWIDMVCVSCFNCLCLLTIAQMLDFKYVRPRSRSPPEETK